MSRATRQSFEVVLDDAVLGPPTTIGALHCERRSGDAVVSFEYHPDYLSSRHAVAIDPLLPLLPGSSYPARGQNMFGVFRDTAPDRWGRTLMERREALEARETGRKVRQLSEWDFLLGVSDVTRMGALRLRSTAPRHAFVDDRERSVPPAARLRELQAIARKLGRDDAERQPEYAKWLAQLVAPGTSLGGARAKTNFADESGDLWLAKFPALIDRHDVGAWEYLAWQLARAAGIDTADAASMRFGKGYHAFATRRFDREHGSRRLYASAMTLLSRNDGDGGSYLDLAQTIQSHGDPEGIADDLAQLYRRIVFSILIGNRDDHLRNHGFLRTPDGWRLAPAFDINPYPGRHEHALAIDASDPSSSIRHLHATHKLYRLDSRAAERIERKVRSSVARWPDIADDLELNRAARQQLAAAIDAVHE